MTPIPKITNVDLAFPADVGWIPPLSEIPEQFRRTENTKQGRFFMDLFSGRVIETDIGMLPREGVSAKDAWRALMVCLSTYGIKHEHKEAAFAFLHSEWFVDLRWVTKDGVTVRFDDAELDAMWTGSR